MMTYDQMTSILDTLKEDKGIPYCYYQFKNKSEIAGKSRYIAYFEMGKERFLADDKVYQYTPQFAVELYTKTKDLEAEKALIDLFEANEVVWAGGETVYIEDEKMFETIFYC